MGGVETGYCSAPSTLLCMHDGQLESQNGTEEFAEACNISVVNHV